MVFSQGRKRRAGILALAAVIGTTAHGRTHSFTAADFASPFTGAVRLGEKIADLGTGLSAAASHAASFGILFGAVVSRMEPGVRKAILAEVEGVPEAGSLSPAPADVPVSRCTAKRPAVKKAPRCSRA